ncbi:hypothetical protein B0H14DRAFT_3007871 [Mycena olivaceomarginata]|nr:hypothetical protein B0H14DRAFT_3007871 [Mycena olivaceomarginata]
MVRRGEEKGTGTSIEQRGMESAEDSMSRSSSVRRRCTEIGRCARPWWTRATWILARRVQCAGQTAHGERPGGRARCAWCGGRGQSRGERGALGVRSDEPRHARERGGRICTEKRRMWNVHLGGAAIDEADVEARAGDLMQRTWARAHMCGGHGGQDKRRAARRAGEVCMWRWAKRG